MKKTIICLLLTFALTHLLWAQTATVHVTVANTSATNCVFARSGQTFVSNFLKKGYEELPLDGHKAITYTIELSKPEFVNFYCDSSATRMGKNLHYALFISPGDNLDFKADFAKKDFGITVTGKGSNNNQPLRRTFFSADFEQFNRDTLPGRLITAINDTAKRVRNNFKTYVEQYKPSAEFIKQMQYNVDYYATQKFYDLKENNKFAFRDAYYRNFAKWQHVTDSLFSLTKLNNAEALPAPNYRGLIRYFLLREKEALWVKNTNADSAAFFRDWYNANVTEGRKAFMDDRSNLLQEKIINKYFTGDVAGYLYAVLFDEAFAEANPANIVAIFNRFKQKYPGSTYVGLYSPTIENIIAKENRTLNNEMVFVADNGTKLNTMEDLLALTKGKTVLLDMWGTWCGPCRSEIEKNGAAIKEHFKNKGLDYFYVANYDQRSEATWKKLIAYFKLTGTHILANEKLSDDIMKKTKGQGYPTYVVIKKDGSYELSKAGYPMDREVLIKQLEEALTVK